MKVITNATCNSSSKIHILLLLQFDYSWSVMPFVCMWMLVFHCRYSSGYIFSIQNSWFHRRCLSEVAANVCPCLSPYLQLELQKSVYKQCIEENKRLCRVSVTQDYLWCLDKIRDYLIVLVVVHTHIRWSRLHWTEREKMCAVTASRTEDSWAQEQ